MKERLISCANHGTSRTTQADCEYCLAERVGYIPEMRAIPIQDLERIRDILKLCQGYAEESLEGLKSSPKAQMAHVKRLISHVEGDIRGIKWAAQILGLTESS